MDLGKNMRLIFTSSQISETPGKVKISEFHLIIQDQLEVVGILEKSGEPWLINSIPITITFA
jgi:hypothetical protein